VSDKTEHTVLRCGTEYRVVRDLAPIGARGMRQIFGQTMHHLTITAPDFYLSHFCKAEHVDAIGTEAYTLELLNYKLPDAIQRSLF